MCIWIYVCVGSVCVGGVCVGKRICICREVYVYEGTSMDMYVYLSICVYVRVV